MIEERKCVSVVIPTRNRSYTLKKVLDSYYKQEFICQVVIIDDCGEDDTKDVVDSFKVKYPSIATEYIRHASRKGASAGRVTGYNTAIGEFVVFGEDDAFLDENYISILMRKMEGNPEIGIVSGRIIYKEFEEENSAALERFKFGSSKKPYLNKGHFGIELNSYFNEDLEVPFTHALFLTKTSLLKKYTYDVFYAKGNGYREETDFQINLFVNEYKILVTNDCHCFHMSRREVQIGGQRINRLKQFYWNVFFTRYMFSKYYERLKERLDLKYSSKVALIVFAISMFKVLFIIPIGKIPKRLLGRM